MQALVYSKNQDNDEINKKLNKQDYEFDKIKTLLNHMMVHNQHYSPEKMDSLKDQYPTTMVPDNKNYSPLEGGHSLKIGGIRNLKHEIISPRSFKILIKTELKGNTYF